MEKYSTDEGFNFLHQSGITGKGTKVCIIEEGCHTNHPIFNSVKEQMEFISVSRTSQFPEGFKDFSLRRYATRIPSRSAHGDQWLNSYNTHGTHIGGIIIGSPQSHGSIFFSGGVAPKTQLVIVSCSNIHLNSCWQTPGTTNYAIALYSFKDVDTNPKLDIEVNREFNFETQQYKDPRGATWDPQEYISIYKELREICFSKLRSSPIYEEKIDDSLIDAFDQAFLSGAKVINCSRILGAICDSLNDYLIPEKILERIKEGLVHNDQILVLSANNQSSDLSQFQEQVYFKQFSLIPEIASRMLIVVNVCHDQKKNDIKLFWSSNWPGKDLQNYTVSAFGTDIISGYSHEGKELFAPHSGTSQAAPKVSGLCVLIEQFYQEKNRPITASEIVEVVKKTSLPLGEPEKYGHGLINPQGILALE